MIPALLILITLTGVTPLTPDQRAELALHDPAEQLEEPGLRPLLENVWAWDRAGPALSELSEPNYDALMSDPAAGRGEAHLIEGTYAGRSRPFMLNQHGPWGGSLTEWVLIVRDEPQQVAVVYFVDPDKQLITPRTGAEVRVPARFYKVWTDTDQAGNPTDYLTFIARSPLESSSASRSGRLGSALPLLLGVLVLAMVYMFILRMSRSARRRRQPGPMTAKSPDDVMLSDRTDTPLPDDPAEALERMAAEQQDS